jgi:hypothetical protein
MSSLPDRRHRETHRAGGEAGPHAAWMGELLQLGTVTKAYRMIDGYSAVRLRRWLRTKHKVRRPRTGPLAPSRALWARGVDRARAQSAVGEGVRSCPRAGCGKICTCSSTSGMWKRSRGRTTKAPPDETGGNRYVRPKRNRATFRLHQSRWSVRALSLERSTSKFGSRRASLRHDRRSILDGQQEGYLSMPPQDGLKDGLAAQCSPR